MGNAIILEKLPAYTVSLVVENANGNLYKEMIHSAASMKLDKAGKLIIDKDRKYKWDEYDFLNPKMMIN